MIELENLKKVYKSKKSTGTTAIDNINLKIGNKGMVFIVGKSGSGKSTLLNLLGGLDSITSGKILINGENISDFNNKQYDSYRNTYIGFIFQEFNVLEQYNVYENIELALKLQNSLVSKNKINELLNKLGLNNLGNRKINELSGGQKQRVAIARALIKEPQIILADEPTGNLDKASGEQIFNILKEISKEKLVIIVSHDIESANQCADRIIEIEDGKVKRDTSEVEHIENTDFKLKKSRLPLSYAFKMAITSFKTKPFKLLMTIILTAFSLIFMGFTVNFALFDKTMLVTNTMKDNNNYVYDIYNSEFTIAEGINSLKLTEGNLDYIKNLTNSKLNLAYNLYSNNVALDFEFGENNIKSEFYQQLSQKTFIDVTDNRVYGNIIGRDIKSYNEIIVHKYFADYIIRFGIIDSNNQLYLPKDYNDLVNSNRQIKLGHNSVVIVGIVDDDDSLFLDDKSSEKFKTDDLRSYFNEAYSSKGSIIYTKGFVDNVILDSNKESILDNMFIENRHVKGNTSFIDSNFQALRSEMSVITKNGVANISSLKKDEIVISIESLRKASPEFDSSFIEYLSSHGNISYDEAQKDFISLFLKEKNYTISSYVHFNLPDSRINEKANIVGISFDNNNYISQMFIDEYEPVLKSIYYVKIYDDNISNLKSVFNNLLFRELSHNVTGTYYNYTVDNASDIASVISIYKYLTKYILIISLVFVLFTFLLFSNFISVSIYYCKKEIGILRALGATNRDVIKIFGYESVIIAIISWVISIIGWLVVCNILNNSIFGSMYFTLNGVVINPIVPIIMFIYTIAIALFITITSISRITKIKPIDAILNK